MWIVIWPTDNRRKFMKYLAVGNPSRRAFPFEIYWKRAETAPDRVIALKSTQVKTIRVAEIKSSL
jgi:hypothetical protein